MCRTSAICIFPLELAQSMDAGDDHAENPEEQNEDDELNEADIVEVIEIDGGGSVA